MGRESRGSSGTRMTRPAPSSLNSLLYNGSTALELPQDTLHTASPSPFDHPKTIPTNPQSHPFEEPSRSIYQGPPLMSTGTERLEAEVCTELGEASVTSSFCFCKVYIVRSRVKIKISFPEVFVSIQLVSNHVYQCIVFIFKALCYSSMPCPLSILTSPQPN